jgi:hypothetical protein
MTKISVRNPLDPTVRPGAVAIQGTQDALEHDEELGQASLQRETEPIMSPLLGTLNAVESEKGLSLKNKNIQKVKKDTSGSSSARNPCSPRLKSSGDFAFPE